MIRRTAIVILFLSHQLNTCSKSATKALEITKDNSNENILKKQSTGGFFKKIVLKYLVKFIGEHLCQSLFSNKVASLRPATLLKRDSGKDVFL